MKMNSIRSWLGYWWISWFGILGGFFMVGVETYRRQSVAARHFSLTLMTVVSLSWIAFFVADSRVDQEHRRSVVNLLTLMGTLLTGFTLLGIGYLVFIAPRIP
jgi:hypothetical protein